MQLHQCSLQARIDRAVGLHRHPYHELHYVIEGRATFEIDGRRIPVAPGDLFYTEAGVAHRMLGGSGSQAVLQYVALFSPGEELQRDLPRWSPGRTLAVGSGWQVLFHRLSRWQEGEPLQRRWAATRLEALLYELLALRSARAPTVEPPAVAAMLQLMQQGIDRQLSIDELAHAAGLAPAYASRLFKASLGVPPLRFATDLRMSRAGVWLRDTRLSVREIAERMGYADPYHFSRCFKRWSGVAPQRYREQAAERSAAGGSS